MVQLLEQVGFKKADVLQREFWEGQEPTVEITVGQAGGRLDPEGGPKCRRDIAMQENLSNRSNVILRFMVELFPCQAAAVHAQPIHQTQHLLGMDLLTVALSVLRIENSDEFQANGLILV